MKIPHYLVPEYWNSVHGFTSINILPVECRESKVRARAFTRLRVGRCPVLPLFFLGIEPQSQVQSTRHLHVRVLCPWVGEFRMLLACDEKGDDPRPADIIFLS